MIKVDADESPDRIMIVITEKDGRVVDVDVGVDSDGAFVSFHFSEKPTAEVEPVLRDFILTWSSGNEFLVYARMQKECSAVPVAKQRWTLCGVQCCFLAKISVRSPRKSFIFII